MCVNIRYDEPFIQNSATYLENNQADSTSEARRKNRQAANASHYPVKLNIDHVSQYCLSHSLSCSSFLSCFYSFLFFFRFKEWEIKDTITTVLAK